MDTTKQRKSGGRRLALTSNDGMATNPDPHVPNNGYTSSEVSDNQNFNRSLRGVKPKRKAPPPPPPTRLLSYNVHHHGDEHQHVPSHHFQRHQQERRHSVRYNNMGGPNRGEASDGGSDRQTDKQQVSLYREFPTVGESQNHTHK